MDASMSEPILSDELMEELQCSGNALVTISKKEKKVSASRNSKNVVEARGQSNMSKKEVKRVDQLRKRKEREVKRTEYLLTIGKNEINESERGLMKSSRDINQFQSTKKYLSFLLKKEKSGLKLSNDELEILYSNQDRDESDLNDSLIQIPMEPLAVKPASETQALSVPSTMFTDNDLFNIPPSENNEPQISKTKRAEKSKKTQSMGKNLLSQMKDSSFFKKPLEVKNIAEIKPTDQPNDNVILENENKKVVYNPVKIIVPSVAGNQSSVKPSESKKNVQSDGDHEPLTTNQEQMTFNKKSYRIVNRPEDVELSRIELPICSMEQEIVEAINQNDVIILCGETGSGKSTQVPQFLYEAGYSGEGRGYIGITQPRRVGAVSTAQRVMYEMGRTLKEVVGYQIRYDATTIHSSTQIKFMTDGILLKEITSDLLLRKYSVVIIDEAHERNINTDVLLGMLSRTLPIRRSQYQEEYDRWIAIPESERHQYEVPLEPLKLIIMSATIRIADFQTPRLFPNPPPVLTIPTRQYPVTTHFAKRTELKNYLQATYKKVCQIHQKLPDGSILLFLTGKREINYMCKKLTRALNKDHNRSNLVDSMNSEVQEHDEKEVEEGMDDRFEIKDDDDDENEEEDAIDEEDDIDEVPGENENKAVMEDADELDSLQSNRNYHHQRQPNPIQSTAIANDDDTTSGFQFSGVVNQSVRDKMLSEALGAKNISGLDGSQSKEIIPDSKSEDINSGNEPIPLKALVLPLYAMMPAALQARVFQPAPPGYRLIIVSTNVSETSLTIPGVRYVVDCGRVKERVYQGTNGIAKYSIRWISKASADQRQGRAGRTGPGHCYRLYSSTFFDQYMEPFRPPEITTIPLEDLILQMKSIGIQNIEGFPFPTQPPKATIKAAITLLDNLGAIEHSKAGQISKKKQMHEDSTKLSTIGTELAKFPINPRFAKMIIMSSRVENTGSMQKLLHYTLTLVAALSESSIFVRKDELPSEKNNHKRSLSGHTHIGKRSKHDGKTLKSKEQQSEVQVPFDSDDEDRSTEGDREATSSNFPIFSHADGDVLAKLRATGAYFFSISKFLSNKSIKNFNSKMAEIDELCTRLHLNSSTMQRVSALRNQLEDICLKFYPSLSDPHTSDTSGPSCGPPSWTTVAPPNATDEIHLRQIILTGYCDCIARKVPIGSVKSYISSGSIDQMSRRKKLTAYLSCNGAVTELLYIHPHSCLYPHDPTATMPEYIIYGTLIKNQRGDTTYMTNVTIIQSQWIANLAKDCPLLKWSPILTSPTPYYDVLSDEVVGYVIPKYGFHLWELPPCRRPLYECHAAVEEVRSHENETIGFRRCDEVYRWFGRLLLEGSILSELSALKSILKKENILDSSAIITQMKPIPKVSEYIRCLVKSRIRNKSQLLEKLKEDPMFLITEIETFLKTEVRSKFRLVWSTIGK